ncbi:MAG TPA: sialidase family protein, partial [Geminicoccaceae bacterium]|nr:sialidase family protein [Geminicoccaceae bacterium]
MSERTIRSFHRGGGLAALGVAMLATGPLAAAEQGRLVRVTPGASPFANCTADDLALQEAVCSAVGAPCVNYPNTEIEPWVDANPTDPRNLIAGWQQDRWSNGGARGNVTAFSKDGGRTWTRVLVPGTSLCSGGLFARNSDPWVSVSPNGTAYFMTLAFQPDRSDGGFGANAMLVNRSTDGGASWGPPVTLIQDTNGQVLNDKNSLTADPTNPSFAYAVWDRLRDFTLPEAQQAGIAALAAATKPAIMDGVAIAREWVRRQKAEAAATGAAQAAPAQLVVEFEGPATFTRTTDGGASWGPPEIIYDPGPNAQTIGNLVAVPPNGNVIDFFVDIPPNGVLRLALLRSFDKGANFESTPTYIENVSFSLTGTITPDLQEPVRDAAILFDVAVDRDSGALYIVWQDTRFRGVDEVAFSRSLDNGQSWSTPVRINRTPASGNLLRQQAFVPSIEVAANGKLVVTYYDFRNDRGEGELTDHWAVFCSADRTRRASWGEELRLTRRSFDMLDAPIA